MTEHDCFGMSIVVDTRKRGSLKGLRRRRECTVCKRRFTTNEFEAETILTESEQSEHKETLRKTLDQFERSVNRMRAAMEEL